MDELERVLWRKCDVDLAKVIERAEAWAIGSSMRPPFRFSPQVKDFGVDVEVVETGPRGRSATMRFTKEGQPSMFNLTSRPEMEGKS